MRHMAVATTVSSGADTVILASVMPHWHAERTHHLVSVSCCGGSPNRHHCVLGDDRAPHAALHHG
eukprot:6744065-Alexandrium_andersonii.AAC.1